MQHTVFPEFQKRNILTVSEVVSRLRWQVESNFRDVWVCGEVTNLTLSRAGHCYFTLKDAESQIRAVCFRLQYQLLRFKPEDGVEIRVRGGFSVYPAKGDLQLIVEVVEPAGPGSLQAAFERLKQRLEEEGLFSPERKKKLPLFPSKIALVTSVAGAALHDILRVLRSRNDQVDILIVPVPVQGKQAAPEISDALRRLDARTDIDVLILARGGGSLEDLWAFNEEAVARAIHRCHIPVISAIGHETDFTISDFVADARAATPSTAAEMVSAARHDLRQRLDDLVARLRTSLSLQVARKRASLQQVISNPDFVSAGERLRRSLRTIGDLRIRLQRALDLDLQSRRHELQAVDRDLHLRRQLFLSNVRRKVESLVRELDAYSPLAVLGRGYAIVKRVDGALVRDPSSVEANERLLVRVDRGEFAVRREELE